MYFGQTPVQPTNPKKINLGPALDLDEAQIDQAAEPSDLDVALAVALWRQTAPKWLGDLLDATPD